MKEITISLLNLIRSTLNMGRTRSSLDRIRSFYLLFIMTCLSTLATGQNNDLGADFRQASNEFVATDGDIHWIGSTLIPNNSAYTEGMGTLQRIVYDDLPSTFNDVHTLRIRIQTQKDGAHAYDFIHSWDQAFLVAQDILPPEFVSLPENRSDPALQECGDAISADAETACLNSQYFIDIPISGELNYPLFGDENTRLEVIQAFEDEYLTRTVRVKGNVDDFDLGSSAVTFAGYDGVYMDYDITWKSSSDQVVIEFAAHISAGYSPSNLEDDGILGYGPNRGASAISGNPYHVILGNFQTGEGGNGSKDNQLQANAVLLRPRCDIEGPDDICVGDEGNLEYTATPVNLQNPTYEWEILDSGTTNVSIVGVTDTPTLVVDPGNQAGTFTVQFTVTNDSGLYNTCTYETDINPPATVDAGSDQTVCEDSPTVTLAGSFGGGASSASWSGGAGTFDPNANSPTATYTPTAGEISAGSVTLTLTTDDPSGSCDAVNDDMTITFDPVATVDAGSDQTVCEDSPTVTLAGSFGGAASSASWSGGAGTFDPNANSPTATYTPSAGEILAGSVTLTLTTDDPSGPCDAVNDDMTITIDPVATVDAGSDQTVCEDSPTVTLAGSFGGAASSASWSGGAGTFDPNANSPTATYTPTAGEILAGSVTLTLTTDDPSGPCDAVNDDMTITFDPVATVDAGSDQTVCEDSPTVTLAGSFGGAASSASWSGGAGTFDPNANSPTATYTPSAGEILAGSVTLTLTTDDPSGPCDAVNDDMTITINPLPTVTILDPPSDPVCSSDPGGISAGFQFIGQPVGGTWSGDVNADGTFNPDLTESTQTIRYDYTDGNDCSNYDEITFEYQDQPQDDIDFFEVCLSEVGTIDLSGYIPADATNIEYSGNAVDSNGDVIIDSTGIFVANITWNLPGNICRLGISITITVVDCIICETAFAYDEQNGICFDNYPDLIPNDSRWGWTNYYSEAGDYTLDLYAGAGQCDITKGTLVGAVNIIDNEDGTIDVQFVADPGYVMSSVHLYVGCEPLPYKKKGNNYEYTVAPGQYPQNPNGNIGYVTNYTIENIDVNGDFYVIGHVDICTSENPNLITEIRSEAVPVNYTLNKRFSVMQSCISSNGALSKTAETSSLTSSSLTESSDPLFSVAPVPFSNELNIGYLFDYTSDVTIQVFDMNGRLLRTYFDTAVNSESLSTFSVDFKTRSGQVYIVRMTTDREIFTSKIIAE